MKSLFVAFGLLAAVGAATASATTISSTFDADLDGWTSQHGTILWVSTGGNPGGFLQETDIAQSNMMVVAPAKFLGDLTGFTLTVDIKQLVGTAGTFGGFGNVTLTGPGGLTMVADLGDPSTDWTTYVLPLTAASFGNNANFSTIIAGVTKIQIALDPRNQQSDDVVGLDNVILSNVQAETATPEPGTFALLGLGGIALGLSRRTKQAKG